jgi:aldehyde dehydrogenase (NAD+)
MLQEQLNLFQEKQCEFFHSGKTNDIGFRIDTLKKLYQVIENNESKISDALKKDLNKNVTESYTSEIGYILNEIKLCVKHLKKWSKPETLRNALINQPGRSYILSKPFGTVLIISPWNYPFGLLFTPMAGAIAAGNCIIAKPSEIAENSSKLIKSLISDNFPEDYITVFEGGAEITQSLINDNVNYIFFTGSTNVGKQIMKSASENLIPVTLELGGKNPCIVDKDVNIDVAARRIVWGKFFNAGQTCVAPDYLLLHNNIRNQFLDSLNTTIREFYGEIESSENDFSHIINEKHFNRISNLMNEGKILIGGFKDKDRLYISPTVITGINYESEIMQEEVFGPVLPVLFYDNLDEELIRIRKSSKPLCLYFFSNNKDNHKKIINRTYSGSVCINGTIHSIIPHNMPFGGVGNSGMGNYHGRSSFDTFSQKRAIMKKSFMLDQKLIYPPYKTSLNILKKALKILY